MTVNCSKAGRMMEQHQYDKLNWWGKRKLRFHLYMCKVCKRYNEDDKVLSKVIRMAGANYSGKCLSEEEKSKMKEHLAKHH